MSNSNYIYTRTHAVCCIPCDKEMHACEEHRDELEHCTLSTWPLIGCAERAEDEDARCWCFWCYDGD
jgi:hypothetical protein